MPESTGPPPNTARPSRYDLEGDSRWRRFAGSNAFVWAPGGPRVYVDVGDHAERRTHVLGLSDGRTIRVLPHRRLTLLRP